MSLNRFGKAFLESLKESRPETYASLEAKGELQSIARSVGEQAESQYKTLLADLMHQTKLPEDYFGRVTALNGLANQAEEIVMSEVLVMDEETEAAMRDGYVDREIPNPLRLKTISSPMPAGAPTQRLRPPPRR